jgi:hypothetical protein
MPRLALVALLAISACRISLDDDGGGGGPDGGDRACTVVTTNPTCVAADTMPTVTLTWIQQNIFSTNCSSTSCHSPTTGGGNPAGGIILTTGSYNKLVNADTTVATNRKLVIPGDIHQSYLMVILQAIKLSEADPSPAPAPAGGYMPLSSPPICCQKLDAIGRWIMAGAMDN